MKNLQVIISQPFIQGFFILLTRLRLVNGGKWLKSSANMKEANKQAKI